MVHKIYRKDSKDLKVIVLNKILKENGVTIKEWEDAYKYHIEKNNKEVQEVLKSAGSKTRYLFKSADETYYFLGFKPREMLIDQLLSR